MVIYFHYCWGWWSIISLLGFPASYHFLSGVLIANAPNNFPEKGYCMRGDQCPYDHGADPMVLDYTPTSYGSSTGPSDNTSALSNGSGASVNVHVPPPAHLAARLTMPPGHQQLSPPDALSETEMCWHAITSFIHYIYVVWTFWVIYILISD